MTRSSPRSEIPHDFLSGAIYPATGQYERGVEEGREAVRLNADFSISYAPVMINDLALNRLDEGKATHAKAPALKLNNPLFYIALYEIAFLQNDQAGMAQQATWSAGKAGVEDELLALESATAAYSGRLKNAREFSRRAADSAERKGGIESAATYTSMSGLRESLYGNGKEARRRATLASERSTGRDAQFGAALA